MNHVDVMSEFTDLDCRLDLFLLDPWFLPSVLVLEIGASKIAYFCSHNQL